MSGSQVSQVGPGLFLSGLDSALNLSVLSSRSVSLIINSSGLEDVSYPQLDGLQVLHVPVQDRPHAPLGRYFDLVAERIHQNRTGTTLVHCSAGRSRSPSLIMAYLMRSADTHLSLLLTLEVRVQVSDVVQQVTKCILKNILLTLFSKSSISLSE